MDSKYALCNLTWYIQLAAREIPLGPNLNGEQGVPGARCVVPQDYSPGTSSDLGFAWLRAFKCMI